MNPDLLVRMGLTPAQAKTYLELVKAGSLTPPQLARRIDESRTAAYMALARLEEIGLARKDESAKKQTYHPASPSALEKFIAARQQELAQVEETYRDALPNLLSYFYTHRGKAGVRFYEGEDGLEKIYEDHLRTREPVHVLRTPSDDEYFGPILYKYMDKRAALGITSELMGAAMPGAMAWAQENDARLKRTTTWFPRKAYSAPVEISIYGPKVSFISFGEEAVGTIIESPQIAQAMRELYAMAKIGAQELMRREEEKRESGRGI